MTDAAGDLIAARPRPARPAAASPWRPSASSTTARRSASARRARACPGWRRPDAGVGADRVRDRGGRRDGGAAATSTTGRVASAESVLVAWPVAPLRSRERRGVRVRVLGPDGASRRPGARRRASRPACSSPPTGRRASSRRTGRRTPAADQPVPLLRGRVRRARRGRRAARLYVTAHGVYEARAQRRARRRPRARARLDQLRPPAALPDLRRDRLLRAGRERARRHARRRLVPRPARLRRRPPQRLRRPARRCSPSSRSRYADGTSRA